MSASYITSSVTDSTTAKKSYKKWSGKTLRTAISFFLFVVFGGMLLVPAFARDAAVTDMDYSSAADASIGRCAAIGHGMHSLPVGVVDFNTVPHADASNRKWNIREAYNTGTGHIAYTGEPAGDESGWNPANWFLNQSFGAPGGGDDDGDSAPTRYEEASSIYGIDNLSGDAVADMEETRGFWRCTVGGLGLVLIPDLMLSFSSIITGFAALVSQLAFSTNFICQDPQEGGMCLNLVGIIGGTGGNSGDGIIGALANSIFFPLSILGAAIAGITLLWTGIVRREYRKAWTQLAWVLGAFILFAALLTQPLQLARAPMVVMNNITACIVGAFNGVNCMSSASVNQPVGEDEVMTNTECLTTGNVSNDELMSMIVSGLTCNIYMAFVLEPWANNSFGVSWAQLNMDNENIQEALDTTGLSASDFRVCMQRPGSSSGFSRAFATGSLYSVYTMLGTSQHAFECSGRNSYVENLGAYQLSLGAMAENNVSNDGPQPYSQASSLSSIHQDLRWYKVASVVNASQTTNANMWHDWNGRFGSRLATGFLAIVASGMGSFVIILTSFWALIFYVGAVLLITFAPLFFLIGMHPTRGKKIFLGWLEMLLSTILKYIASALFLIIAISFYAAVLGTSSGFVTAFLFILLITFALILYRKEIIDLLSRLNMGGEKLSHNSAQQMWNKAKEWGGGIAGSGVGRTLADSDDISKTFKNEGVASGLLAAGASLTQGANEGNKRFLRNQRSGVLGMAGEGVREYDSASNQNRSNRKAMRDAEEQDRGQERSEAQATAATAQTAFDETNPGEVNENAAAAYNEVADETEHVVDNNGNEVPLTRAEVQRMLDERIAQEKAVQQQTMNGLMNDPDISDEDKENLADRHNLNNKIADGNAEYNELGHSIEEKKARLEELRANGGSEREISDLEAEIAADEEALAAIEDTLNININDRDAAHGRISDDAQHRYEIAFAENARAAGVNFSQFSEHEDDMLGNRVGELGLLSQDDRGQYFDATDKLDTAHGEYDEATKGMNQNIGDYINTQADNAWHDAYRQSMDRQKLEWKQENGNKEIDPKTWRGMQNQAKSFADSERGFKHDALMNEHGASMAGGDIGAGPSNQSDFMPGYSDISVPASSAQLPDLDDVQANVNVNPMFDAATGKYTTDRGAILDKMGGDWNDADVNRARSAQEYEFDQMKQSGEVPAHKQFDAMAPDNLVARDPGTLDPKEMEGLNRVKNNVQGRIDDAGLNMTADDYIDYKNGDKSLDDLGVSEADLAGAGVWRDQSPSVRDKLNDNKDLKAHQAEQSRVANLPEDAQIDHKRAQELGMNQKEHAYRQQSGDIPKTEAFDENAAEYLLKRDPSTLNSEQKDLTDLYKRDIQTKIDEGFANLDEGVLPQGNFTADNYADIKRGKAKPEDFGLSRDVLNSMNIDDATRGDVTTHGRAVGSSPQQREMNAKRSGDSDDGNNPPTGGGGPSGGTGGPKPSGGGGAGGGSGSGLPPLNQPGGPSTSPSAAENRQSRRENSEAATRPARGGQTGDATVSNRNVRSNTGGGSKPNAKTATPPASGEKPSGAAQQTQKKAPEATNAPASTAKTTPSAPSSTSGGGGGSSNAGTARSAGTPPRSQSSSLPNFGDEDSSSNSGGPARPSATGTPRTSSDGDGSGGQKASQNRGFRDGAVRGETRHATPRQGNGNGGRNSPRRSSPPSASTPENGNALPDIDGDGNNQPTRSRRPRNNGNRRPPTTGNDSA